MVIRHSPSSRRRRMVRAGRSSSLPSGMRSRAVREKVVTLPSVDTLPPVKDVSVRAGRASMAVMKSRYTGRSRPVPPSCRAM